MYFSKNRQGFIHQKSTSSRNSQNDIKINQKMGTLVSILLALVMEILAPTSLSSSEVKESINRIEVEEVILYFEELPTVTSIKNC